MEDLDTELLGQRLFVFTQITDFILQQKERFIAEEYAGLCRMGGHIKVFHKRVHILAAASHKLAAPPAGEWPGYTGPLLQRITGQGPMHLHTGVDRLRRQLPGNVGDLLLIEPDQAGRIISRAY